MLGLECRMTAPQAHQVPPTTTTTLTLPSSGPATAAAATAATATTWNPTQTPHTIAEYFPVNRYNNMETIPESLNGELPPLPSSHGSSRGGHTYNHPTSNQNLHVPKRSNTYTVSTSSSSQNRNQQRGAESQSHSQCQQQQKPSLNRSFSSPLSPQSDSGSAGLGSRMIGGGKSTQRVREWVKRSNSSRTESKPKTTRASSNSGHQTLEIIHLGGGRLESNGHVQGHQGHIHSSSLSANFLAPTSQQTRTSRANSIDSRVTQWSDLYHDPPESLTVITKPATATGKPSRPVSPELHERPQLRDVGKGSGSGYGGSSRREEVRERGKGHQQSQQQHRHTKSDGSIHPAPLRVPSNSSSSSSLDKKDGQAGAAVVTKPEETWKGQGHGQSHGQSQGQGQGQTQGGGLTRSNSKWKPLPVPPPPGAPGSVTPLVNNGEDNIHMAGAIGVSPLTSVDLSESEFGEREDTPRQHQHQQQGYDYDVQGQRSENKSRTQYSPHATNDTSALGIGYGHEGGIGLGVLSPPLTPPEHQHEREAAADREPGSATTTCTYGMGMGIRESIWPVPPSYAQSTAQVQSQGQSQSYSQSQFIGHGAPSRSATAPPEKQRQYHHQHQQKPSTSSSLASASTLTSSHSSQSVPTHMIPKRSDSLSYSRSRQHRPQISTSASTSTSTSTSSPASSSSSRSTIEKTSRSGTEQAVATAASFAVATATRIDTSTPTTAAPQLQTPTVTPPTPIVTVPTPTATVPTPPARTISTPGPAPTPATAAPAPTTPTWSPRSYLSSKELLWLHRNYRGITPFLSAWGLQKGLSDEAQREEGLKIMRELIAAELEEVNHSIAKAAHESGPQADNEDKDDYNGLGKNGGGNGDKSWLDFEASPGRGEKRADVNEGENGNDKEGKGSPNGYAALKGQGVRMKPRGQGDVCKERRGVVDHDNGEDEGSDFF